MGKKPSAAQWPLSSPRCPINSVSFITSRMPPSRSTRRIDMPRPNSAKHVRGVRPLERALEERSDPEAEAIRGYCLAVRSSLCDDGRPPLEASGLKLQDRLTQISDSITRVEQKKAFHHH